ncbi:MAG: LysM peptidoglycan-binding domain-containing protein [Streptosporangiaceae bacterium]
MSAMRAEELPILPELPAASPQDSTPSDTAVSDTAPNDTAGSDSARTRAAVRWTAPLDPPAPGQAPRPEPSGDQTACPRPARDQATRPETANPPLRLTRRGRVVVAVAAALVLAALSLVIASTAQATNHPVSSRAAQQGLAQVTVHPGQSLWSVAESADPAADTRVVIQQIIELNGLTGNVVFTGQRLWVPRG